MTPANPSPTSSVDIAEPEAGDILLVREPDSDWVARWVRRVTDSDYSHCLLALGAGLYAECHVGRHTISVYGGDRLKHQANHKYERIDWYRHQGITNRESTKNTIQAIVSLLIDPDYKQRAPRFAFGDGYGRSKIEQGLLGPRLTAATTRRWLKAIASAIRNRHSEKRMYCSEFVFHVTHQAGVTVNQQELQSRLNKFYGINPTPRHRHFSPDQFPPAKPLQPNEKHLADSFLGKVKGVAVAGAGLPPFLARTARYFLRPDQPSAVAPESFVTPASLSRSTTLSPHASWIRGADGWGKYLGPTRDP